MQVASSLRETLITGGKTVKDVSHDIARHVENKPYKTLVDSNGHIIRSRNGVWILLPLLPVMGTVSESGDLTKQ
jgi:hypothetical protein